MATILDLIRSKNEIAPNAIALMRRSVESHGNVYPEAVRAAKMFEARYPRIRLDPVLIGSRLDNGWSIYGTISHDKVKFFLAIKNDLVLFQGLKMYVNSTVVYKKFIDEVVEKGYYQ